MGKRQHHRELASPENRSSPVPTPEAAQDLTRSSFQLFGSLSKSDSDEKDVHGDRHVMGTEDDSDLHWRTEAKGFTMDGKIWRDQTRHRVGPAIVVRVSASLISAGESRLVDHAS